MVKMVKDYNDADVKFVRDMIPHHQMAVKMANEEIAKGDNLEIGKLAVRISQSQEDEITMMKSWLKSRGLDAGTTSKGM